MKNLSPELQDVYLAVLEEQGNQKPTDLNDDTNVFELIDSFSIVNMLLETEQMLEEKTGQYVSVADETLFDAKHSPLLKWSSWVAHVESRLDQ